jgi:hypothetical protein
MSSEVENCAIITKPVLNKFLWFIYTIHSFFSKNKNNRVLNWKQLLFNYGGIHGSGMFFISKVLIWRGKI